MKKILLLALALALMALAGCSQTPVATTTTAPETTVPPTTTEAGVDYSKYASKVNVLCYNIYYKDVDRRAENIVDWIPHIQTFMAENG